MWFAKRLPCRDQCDGDISVINQVILFFIKKTKTRKIIDTLTFD